VSYYIPQWEERTSYGFRRIDPYAKLFEDRIIFVGTPISDDVANAVMAQLLCLQQMDPDRDIQLYINSPGGHVYSGLAIYDTIRFIKPDVATICCGIAMSMASLILAGGAEGKRQALPNSRILIHQPHGGYQGQTTDIAIHARESQFLRRRMEEIYAEHTGRTAEQVGEDLERDRFFTPDEAVEYGLIDRVFVDRNGNGRSGPYSSSSSST
jgi:ATP-dependent Clp protease, protease subunit